MSDFPFISSVLWHTYTCTCMFIQHITFRWLPPDFLNKNNTIPQNIVFFCKCPFMLLKIKTLLFITTPQLIIMLKPITRRPGFSCWVYVLHNRRLAPVLNFIHTFDHRYLYGIEIWETTLGGSTTRTAYSKWNYVTERKMTLT